MIKIHRLIVVQMSGFHSDIVHVSITRWISGRKHTARHQYEAGNYSQGRLEQLNLTWTAEFCDSITITANSAKG